jgi:hypothetical protein
LRSLPQSAAFRSVDRITVNLSIANGAKLRQRAADDRRSLSDYVERLVLRDIEGGSVLVGPELAAAIAEARRLGIDVLALVRERIAQISAS